MSLAKRTAGLCGSGVFLLAAAIAFFKQTPPWEVLFVSLPAGLISGVFGYIIGDILAKPKGPPARRSRQPERPAGQRPASTGEAPVEPAAIPPPAEPPPELPAETTSSDHP